MLEAGFIKPIQFLTWLSNAVLVKKINVKWIMCVDYSNLNKACPKDFYPLLNIDQLIDVTASHELLSFIDSFLSYNRIKMNQNDWEKIAFITHRGAFAYCKMPFGLMNAGAAFQRTMNDIFASQIGRNIEVYVDNIIIKSKNKVNHEADLRKSFETIRRYKMKLNPAKCYFGLTTGKFLGYLLTQRGIEADPTQIKVIEEIKSPTILKELQSLT